MNLLKFGPEYQADDQHHRRHSNQHHRHAEHHPGKESNVEVQIAQQSKRVEMTGCAHRRGGSADARRPGHADEQRHAIAAAGGDIEIPDKTQRNGGKKDRADRVGSDGAQQGAAPQKGHHQPPGTVSDHPQRHHPVSEPLIQAVDVHGLPDDASANQKKVHPVGPEAESPFEGKHPAEDEQPQCKEGRGGQGDRLCDPPGHDPKEDGQRAHANFRNAFRRGNQQRQGKQRRAGQEMEESFFSFQALGGGGRRRRSGAGKLGSKPPSVAGISLLVIFTARHGCSPLVWPPEAGRNATLPKAIMPVASCAGLAACTLQGRQELPALPLLPSRSS